MDESGRASGMGILGRHEPGTVGNAGGMAGGVMLHCTPELVRRLGNSEQFPLLNLLAKVCLPVFFCLRITRAIGLLFTFLPMEEFLKIRIDWFLARGVHKTSHSKSTVCRTSGKTENILESGLSHLLYL